MVPGMFGEGSPVACFGDTPPFEVVREIEARLVRQFFRRGIGHDLAPVFVVVGQVVRVTGEEKAAGPRHLEVAAFDLLTDERGRGLDRFRLTLLRENSRTIWWNGRRGRPCQPKPKTVTGRPRWPTLFRNGDAVPVRLANEADVDVLRDVLRDVKIMVAAPLGLEHPTLKAALGIFRQCAARRRRHEMEMGRDVSAVFLEAPVVVAEPLQRHRLAAPADLRKNLVVRVLVEVEQHGEQERGPLTLGQLVQLLGHQVLPDLLTAPEEIVMQHLQP